MKKILMILCFVCLAILISFVATPIAGVIFVIVVLLVRHFGKQNNSFVGVVRYKTESTGTEPVDVPPGFRSAEVKVQCDNMYTESSLFFPNEGNVFVLVRDNVMMQCFDYSRAIAKLRSVGYSLTYKGAGKLCLSETNTEEKSEKLTIPVSDAGSFYLEYVDCLPQKILGYDVKKVVVHRFLESGKERLIEMWYTDKIGPKYNYVFNGVKGFVLKVVNHIDNDKVITTTATQIIKDNIKLSDFILPSDYDVVDMDFFELLNQELGEITKNIEKEKENKEQ